MTREPATARPANQLPPDPHASRRHARAQLRRAVPAAWFALLTGAVVGPWWARPGYVWLLDSVWGPHEPVHWSRPDTSLVWQVVVHVLSQFFTAPVAEKLILTSVLWTAGLSGYYLARRLLPPLWATVAGTMYLLNPFVFERLLGGQWIVLAGYAALPAALALAHDALESGGRRASYRWVALLVLFPLISPHFAYINYFLTALFILVFVLVRRPNWLRSRRVGLWALAAAVLALAANWFWLASPAGRMYRTFTTLDFAAFRTAADPVAGVLGNVLGLYGFWHGEAFIEPKDLLGPAWIMIAAAILVLATAGAVRAWRQRNPLALALALAVPTATALAVGYAAPPLRPLIGALMQALPGFRGLRDSEKLVGVLALAYAVLAPYAAAALVRRWWPNSTPAPTARAAAVTAPAALLTATALMLLAAVSVTGLAAGASHQVPVADYPRGWYAVAARLRAAPHATVAVLPWHNYLHLDFAGNAYVAQPAAVFFANPVLSSDEIDNILTARPDTAADRLMLSGANGQITPAAWDARLRALGVRYVILEQTDDATTYAPLVAPLTPLYQDGSIALYQL